MAQLVIDNLEEDLRDKLADLARNHGRSVEEEIRDILRAVVIESAEPNLGTRLANRFAGCGLDHEIPEWRGQPLRPRQLRPMIILDTNIISAMMQSSPDPAVKSWLNAQRGSNIWTTAISVFETRLGLALLPSGKRQRALHEAFENGLNQDLKGRVLDFDTASAGEAGTIAAKLQAIGRPIDMRDAMIAGTVAAHHGTLATRNTRHFADAGISLVNP